MDWRYYTIGQISLDNKHTCLPFQPIWQTLNSGLLLFPLFPVQPKSTIRKYICTCTFKTNFYTSITLFPNILRSDLNKSNIIKVKVMKIFFQGHRPNIQSFPKIDSTEIMNTVNYAWETKWLISNCEYESISSNAPYVTDYSSCVSINVSYVYFLHIFRAY